jgi:hypothetical protein
MDQNCRLKADGHAYPRAEKPVAGEVGTCEVGTGEVDPDRTGLRDARYGQFGGASG